MAANGHIMNGSSNGHSNGVSNGQFNGLSNETNAFLHKVFDILVREGIVESFDVNNKVVDFKHPKELMSKMDLELSDKGVSEEALLEACRDTIKYSVKTGHPHFFNQLFSGFDKVGLAGAWLSDTVNTSHDNNDDVVIAYWTVMSDSTLQDFMDTVFLCIPVVLKKMRDIVGYEAGDGIFCPGGSISNMYGLSLARYYKFPEIKTEGMHGKKLCFFISQDAHYSLMKGAGFLGIGINNVRIVPVDNRGRMVPEELERMIVESKQEGYEPFFVDATSGTTVVGAYDQLNPIADVCERHGLWLHVDCCWGGGALLSKKYRPLLNGIERSDSIAWNPHKMMGTPLQCCAFLTKHENLLKECHSANASYLFQQDKSYDVSFDTGDKSIQCGRKVDVFKLWLMWKSKGNMGFEKEIDNVFDQAKYLAEEIKKKDEFRIVFEEPECTNVCFWYIPPSLRGQPETPEWWEKLSQVAPKIKERMMTEGTMLIGYQPQREKVNFFRMVVANLQATNQDMDFVVSEIDRLGQDL